jgi:hypothetical protein
MKTFREFILECKVVEGVQPLPREKMLKQIDRKSQGAHSTKTAERMHRETEKSIPATSMHNMSKKRNLEKIIDDRKNEVKKTASQIKKMKSKLRTHDPVDSRFKELENRDRGEKNKK